MSDIESIIEANRTQPRGARGWWVTAPPKVLELIDTVVERNDAGALDWDCQYVCDIIKREWDYDLNPDRVRNYLKTSRGRRSWRRSQ